MKQIPDDLLDDVLLLIEHQWEQLINMRSYLPERNDRQFTNNERTQFLTREIKRLNAIETMARLRKVQSS